MSYVYAGYGITIGALVAYALRVAWRGRVLRRALPAVAVPAVPASAGVADARAAEIDLRP